MVASRGGKRATKAVQPLVPKHSIGRRQVHLVEIASGQNIGEEIPLCERCIHTCKGHLKVAGKGYAALVLRIGFRISTCHTHVQRGATTADVQSSNVLSKLKTVVVEAHSCFTPDLTG